MPRGGKRKGAGRKPNLIRPMPRTGWAALPPAVKERIAADGPLPLEVMLKYMRLASKEADDAAAALAALTAADLATLGSNAEDQFKVMLAKVQQLAGLRMQAQACAKEAAPYCHAPAKAADKPQTGDTLTEEDRLAALVRIEAEDIG